MPGSPFGDRKAVDGSPSSAARLFALLGCVLAFTGVLLGAFGTHALKAALSAEALAIWQTAQQYQSFHALALIVVAGILHNVSTSRVVAAAGWCFFIGILVFSGSLYLLSVSGVRALGAITPIGGLSFLLGWVLLTMGVWRDWK
jgi:uncharacterized membrane protein YgdD (TMEM256/DUF423 family)